MRVLLALLASQSAAFGPHPRRLGALRPSRSSRSSVTMMAAPMPLPGGGKSLVALATPMADDGAVDLDALRALLRWHVAEGTAGVVILGTTGEASCLTNEEKEEVMAATREEIGGVLPIVVGTGTISTAATIAATKQAKLFGADAALVVTPYYVKPSQAGLLAHFTAVADAVDLPIVLYNVPGRTGVDMTVETTVKLSKHANVVGLKDATGANNRVGPLRAVCGAGFRQYSGEDGMARDYVTQGGDGVISVTANVAPAAVAQVMAAAGSGDAKAAEKVDASLQSLHRDLFCEANPIPVKWALQRMGRTAGGIRSPLSPLDLDFHDRVYAALAQASCVEGGAATTGSFGWPSKDLVLRGHLFDTGLINQALDIIETSGGDLELSNLNVSPNDQFNTEFNFKRPSSVDIRVFGVDDDAVAAIVARLHSLVEVMDKAEGSLTEV